MLMQEFFAIREDLKQVKQASRHSRDIKYSNEKMPNHASLTVDNINYEFPRVEISKTILYVFVSPVSLRKS